MLVGLSILGPFYLGALFFFLFLLCSSISLLSINTSSERVFFSFSFSFFFFFFFLFFSHFCSGIVPFGSLQVKPDLWPWEGVAGLTMLHWDYPCHYQFTLSNVRDVFVNTIHIQSVNKIIGI